MLVVTAMAKVSAVYMYWWPLEAPVVPPAGKNFEPKTIIIGKLIRESYHKTYWQMYTNIFKHNLLIKVMFITKLLFYDWVINALEKKISK